MPPLRDTNPTLISALLSRIISVPSLAGQLRNVYCGLIPHMRDVAVAQAILGLADDELGDLCIILLAGLEEARKAPTISMSPGTAGLNVVTKLGIHGLTDTQSLSSPARIPRREPFFPDGINVRHKKRCALTGGVNGAQACHIIPHASASISHPFFSPYWALLGTIFGEHAFQRIWQRVGGRNSSQLYNGLLLNQESHLLWDECSVNLVMEPDNNLHTTLLTVHLLADTSKTSKWGTWIPQDPAEQCDGDDSDLGFGRPISHGNQCRIWTMDPHAYPLPDSYLMAIRAVLNLAVTTCGVSESLKARLAREKASSEARKRAEPKRQRDEEEEEGGAEEGDKTKERKTRTGTGTIPPPFHHCPIH